MELPLRPHHIPPRLTAGAFVLSSGLRKFKADEEAQKGLHGMAAGAYPFLAGLSPHRFTRLLAFAEVGVGAALLTPFVPSAVAGAGLTAFSTGLVGLYLRTPGTHLKGTPVPTEQGIPLAKDTWLLGIGLGLLGERAEQAQAHGLGRRAAACRRRRRRR